MRAATLCAGAVALALLAGCGGDPADDLHDQLTAEEGGNLSEDQADCVIERVEEELDDDQIEELADADVSDDPQQALEDLEDLDQEAVEVFFTAVIECSAEGGGFESGG